MQRQVFKDIDLFFQGKAAAQWWLKIIKTDLYESAALFEKLCEITALPDSERRETLVKKIHDREVKPIQITQEQAEIFQKHLIDSILWESKKPGFSVEGSIRLVCNEDFIQDALKKANIRLKGSEFIDRVYVDVFKDGNVTYTNGDETGKIYEPSRYSLLFENQNKSSVNSKQTNASSVEFKYR